MTRERDTYWVVTADGHTGRLLRFQRTLTGRPDVTVDEEIHDHLVEHEGPPSSSLRGKGSHSGAFRGGEEKTSHLRFAREIAVWLEQKAEHLRIDRVVVFAPPGFLGALHEAWSPRFAIQVEEHQGDLAHLRPGDLADHPCIAGLMADGQT